LYISCIYFQCFKYSKLPKHIIFPAITLTIAYWLANVNPSVQAYFTITFIVVIAANTSVGFGTFLAIVAPNIDSTMGLIGMAFFPLLIFSGFLINANSIPFYFIWIKYISWVFYANEAIMITLWSNTSLSCSDAVSYPIAAAINATSNATTSSTTTFTTCLKTGDEVLTQLAMNKV
jgi:ABC-type multidrug transport system permease subunit